jgi:hypothetical protein
MTMTIDELIQSGVDQANSVLVGKPGAELLPAFVLQFNDRPPTIVATPWGGDDDKAIVVEAMRRLLKTYRASVHSYLFWSEAWMAHEDARHPSGLMPRDREDRKEVVIVNAFDKQGRGKLATLEILRDDKGVVIELKRQDDIYDRLEGQLHNLLQDE